MVDEDQLYEPDQQKVVIQGHKGCKKRESSAERRGDQRNEASSESNANDPLLGKKRNSVLGSGVCHSRRDASSAAANGRSARVLADPK